MNLDILFNAFGGKDNFMNALNNFGKDYASKNNGISPMQDVQNKLDSGEMSQEQFNKYRKIANALTGKNY